MAEQPLDLELLGTVVAEYQAEARVGAVRTVGERLSVDLVLDQTWQEDVEDLARTHVRIDAAGVLGWELAGTPGPDVTHLELHEEHPALRLHTEISDSVYVRGAPPEPELLAYRLRMLVESETGGWYPPSECFHRLDDLPAHLAGGRGLIARGPRGLIDGIARLLTEAGVTEAGVTADVVPDRHPRRRHVTDGGPPPRFLDLGAAGHVVATSFAAHGELPVKPVL
ncbi:hypothetical protein XF36_23695 [Pseudonocardia sp. HH130629-09]|nr:hypothetical protein XF36_23695 [Pseudonocardia sp. HH130629-09]